MYGAILGDIIGAPYELYPRIKTKRFPLFSTQAPTEGHYWFTDDTVMTVAVAEALLRIDSFSPDEIKAVLIAKMRSWGQKYSNVGYGGSFIQWLAAAKPVPYGSYGNGAAMRVSTVGWLYDDIFRTRFMARMTAEVSHNHIEGIKGAESIASAIFLARSGYSKRQIRSYITREFGYDLSRTCAEIRPSYRFDPTCQGTVPAAITSFLEGRDVEDCIRTAVSLGGDSDTLACIAGSIAEAYYGLPAELIQECRSRLTEDILNIVDGFYDRILNGIN